MSESNELEITKTESSHRTDPLAYMTARAHGLDEECQSILEASGTTEDQVTLSSIGQPISPPKPIVPTYKSNWPAKGSSTSIFEKVLLGQEGAEDEVPVTNGYSDEGLLQPDEPAQRNGHLEDAGEDEDAAGWDMGGDVEAEPDNDFVTVESADAGAGGSETDLWIRNSLIAADRVAGGSFESAMQLLNRQIGAVNFQPLQWRFEEIYQASRTFLPANPGLPPLVNYLRRTVDETDPSKVLPLIPRDLDSIKATELQAGKTQMRTNKLEDGVQTFRKILHLLMVNAVSSQQGVAEVTRLLHVCRLPPLTVLRPKS